MLPIALSVGCSPVVARSGYEPAPVPTGCRVAVTHHAMWAAEDVDIIGTTDVHDSGFSTDCSEEVVVATLREEACRARADAVDIFEEHPPDGTSTCFRAKARLVRMRDREAAASLHDDPRYGPAPLEARSREHDRSSGALIWGAVLTGVLAGVVSGIAVGAAAAGK